MKDVIDLIGRIFLSFIFLYEAYDTIAFTKETKALMTEYGIHWNQGLLVWGGAFVLILGGILILIGYRSSFGAILLLLYWVPVTLIVHDFWNTTGDVRRIEAIWFMKNLAITGGLLMVLVNGSGRYSIKRLFATSRVRGA